MTKWSTLALAVAATLPSLASASAQSESAGFIDDSNANLLLRNAYFLRDHGDGVQDQSRWGQGFIGTFESGFTPGLIGVGVDAYGLVGIKLDTGKSQNDGGIAFFATDSSGSPLDDISEAGAAIKFRLSNSVLKYGNQLPAMPVLSYGSTRLLPQTFTGTLLTVSEVEGLTLNAGRFTAQNDNNRAGWDVPGRALKSINVLGGSYQASKQLSGALYFSNIDDVAKKHYANLNYLIPLAESRSLGLDFNIYHTDYDAQYIEAATADTDAGLPGVRESRENTIWSLKATYSVGAHSFIVAHQRNSGDRGYDYDIGDGGDSIYLANSFLSDFNAEDERSWQASYELDFSGYGVPGLRYKTAYIRGSNIQTGGNGKGSEREFFNQVSYVVQNGPAKDLSLKLRNSILRTSNGYWNDMNEVRVFVEYPLSLR